MLSSLSICFFGRVSNVLFWWHPLPLWYYGIGEYTYLFLKPVSSLKIHILKIFILELVTFKDILIFSSDNYSYVCSFWFGVSKIHGHLNSSQNNFNYTWNLENGKELERNGCNKLSYTISILTTYLIQILHC